MSQIQISLQGTNAIALAQLLETLPGFEASYEVAQEEVTRGGRLEKIDRVLVTLTAIVALGSKTVDLSNGVLDLVERVKDLQVQPAIELVTIANEGERETLENPTPEQFFQQFLATVQGVQGP